MKIPYRWLHEFAPFAPAADQVAAQLTVIGLEVEAVTAAAPAFTGVIVGEVLESARHPAAEKLSVCRVTTDGADRLQIICGASNVRAGMKVAVAKAGALLPGGVAIQRAKLRGLVSEGMLCSARELGLGDEHDGILELPAALTLNQDVRDALDLDDRIFEVNTTPNRGDCMSVFGIARDYTAAQRHRYLRYATPAVEARHEQRFPVRIAAEAACPRFAGRVLRGMRVGAGSPPWLRERLRRIGINSISPVVDVTNYVMAELGQPMHAYDLARLVDGITVRWAVPGERVTLLDDREYALMPDILVIADAAGPVGVAGLMGGRRTAIADQTRDVFLEAAHFTPQAIAGRARRLGLFTDAAQRFERGVDPSLPALAIERATALLVEIGGGEPGPVQIHGRGAPTRGEPFKLRSARLERLLGVAIPDDEVQILLAAISEGVETTADGWVVSPPSHRFDLRIEADLIEEIARLRGFDSIAERHATAPQVAGVASEARVPHERLLSAITDRGYCEAITYSFVDPALQRPMFPDVPTFALENPISADLSEMRVSLWPGLLRACRENLRRQQARVRLFEIGKKYQLQGQNLAEIDTLAGVVAGSRWPEQWGSRLEAADFYDVKADLGALFALTGGADDVRFEAAELYCLRPGRTARIVRDGAPIGWLGELHPRLSIQFDISTPLWFFEVETDLGFISKHIQLQKISRFPSVRRDLAVIVDENVPIALLRENVTVSASGLLSDLIIFDVYRGPGIDSGRKSVALGLILQESSRTLTDVDADAVVTSVVARLRDVFSATIRD